MKTFSGISLIVLLAFSTAAAKSTQPINPKTDYYTIGKKVVKQGDFEQALHIWLQAKLQLDVPQTRIGVAFIELVAKEDLQKYYEYATIMYKWGLSANKVQSNKEALKKIIKRVGILADDETYNKWDDLLEANNSQIYQELLHFWKRHDLTPATNYNERLIEHWQRISYSRKHFNHNNNGPLKADDRAKIYLRYGLPDYKQHGQLKFLRTFRWGSRKLKRRARRHYTRPEYDLWVYYELPDYEEKLMYLFGETRFGYGLARSVGDFIPSGAFTTTDTYFEPAMYLQLIYYHQLAPYTTYFATIFSRMQRKVMDPNSVVGPWFASNTKLKNRTDMLIMHGQAPNQVSRTAEEITDIPVSVSTYRLLNKQNEPVLAAFVESKPLKAFWFDYNHNYAAQTSDSVLNSTEDNYPWKYYRYKNIVQIYNENGKVTDMAIAATAIAAKRGSESKTTFIIPAAVDEGTEMLFIAKLINSDPVSSSRLPELPFPDSLRGLGKTTIEQPPPLDNIKEKLQMGDLIVGYNFEDSIASNARFPFTVANDRTIPVGETLVVHVEVYHLNLNRKEFGNLSISYQIIPEEGFFGFLDKDPDPLRLTLNLETLKTRYVENLRIKTRKLPPGDYTLMMTVTDEQTKQQVQRKFEFDIVETSKQ